MRRLLFVLLLTAALLADAQAADSPATACGMRGGEKLSAKEIEDLLFEHPKVRQVAIIPMPDPKLGERVCAVVVPADRGAPPTLEELVIFLTAREISRRKLPVDNP